MAVPVGPPFAWRPPVQAAATARDDAPRRFSYTRREPDKTALYCILQRHLETFLSLARDADEHGVGLPQFVERELRGFLKCGILAHGFARFRCQDCGLDRLVALSCKGRGFCPSCGGKRMTQLAAHLVDRVIPIVQTRQYVLSLPPMLRQRLAYDHVAQKRVVGIFANALLRFYAERAREHGIDGGRAGGKTGALTFIQRFGSALNLNLHLHVIVLDGIFIESEDGLLRFHPLPAPTPRELVIVLSTVRLAVLEYAIQRDLLSDDAASELALDSPALAALLGASANNVRALGPRSGAPVQRLLALDPKTTRKRRKHKLSAQHDGFDLHAAVSVRARRRKVLERIINYCARPPLGTQRIEQLPDGRVRLALKTPYSDGTSHMVFDPLEFIGRLTALIPRPHKNLLVYHGVLAARSKWRSRVVVYGRPAAPSSDDNDESAERLVPRSDRAGDWAALMRRAFDLDVLACPKCSGRLKLIACIQRPAAIRAILRHLGLPAEAPQPHPARAPPWATPSDPFAAA